GRKHGVECEQILNCHRLSSKLEAEEPEVQVNRLVQNEVGAGEQGDDDRGQSQHLENRVAHGVDHRHPNALAVKVLRLAEKTPTIDSVGSERLDHLDALKTLLKDFVNR